jgi:flagellar hook-basal body complex protein FliE
MQSGMSITPIDRVIAAIQPLAPRPPQEAGGATEGGASFVSIMREQLDQMVEMQNNAAQLQQQLAAGQITDVNQVVLAVQKADLALNFALQLRNKVIEAYQEISRMQV